MDAYEATRRVFTRIQALDPDNAAKIMGLLLIQDHSEKEMIRLAFGPENLLHSLIVNARKDLGLLPSSPATTSPFLLSRQTSSSRLLGTIPPPLSVSSPSWAPPQPFSRSNGSTVILDDLQSSNDDLISPTASPFFGGGDIMDEFHLQDQLSFLNDSAAYGASSPTPNPKQSDLFYPEECRSPNGGDGTLLPYGMGWGVNGHHRRSCSVTDLCLGSDPAGFGWRPCLYFARGYCKNGSSCRFLHGLPDESAAAGTGTGKMDAGIEQQCHELLLRSKSQRLSGTSQFMASAAAYPYSPTGSLPQSPSSKGMSFLLQQQQNDSQRAAAAAAAAAALMLGGDEAHKFMGRSRMERTDFAGMVNPSSRQIYLTFPADSTFREEDVSNYFSIYGPVHDVRIPYQQKRMFGFVTFVYPETVKIILAKGNPHFVCDSRVLVKPYKEKGKVPDKYRKQQQPSERGDFSGCSTPTGMDLRDPFDLGTRMMFGNCSSPDVMLRRKMEEQQQAAELQQAIEMQTRRFVGLHLLDLKNRSLSSVPSLSHPATLTTTPAITVDSRGGGSSQDGSPLSEQSPGTGPGAALSRAAGEHEMVQQSAVNGGDKEESGGEGGSNVDSDFQESAEHNLPDSPFASPTKSSILTGSSPSTFGEAEAALASNGGANQLMAASSLLPPTSTLDMASFKSCFFQMPRFSSSHGAVGM